MFKNYLIVAWRHFFRQKGYSFINISGLSLGMVCCILIFLWVQDELNFDGFHKNINQLYLVGQSQDYATGQIRVPMTSTGLGPALKADYPEIVETVRMRSCGEVLLKYKNQGYVEKMGRYVDPAFITMFSFTCLRGNPQSALSDPHSLVITESLAKKIFGSEDPIGKTLFFQKDTTFTVSALFKDTPDNSTFKFDFLINFNFLKESGEDLNAWGFNNNITFIQLRPDVDYAKESLKIEGRIKKEIPKTTAKLYLIPFSRLHLYLQDWNWGGDIRYVYIFSLIALFVLFLACINFVNLTTARSVKRAREVSLRKVVGATRQQLLWQFLGESFLLSLLAILMALFLTKLIMPLFNVLASKDLQLNLISNGSLTFCLFIIILVTAFASGLYPAFVLSAFKPAGILKGLKNKGDKHSRFRRVLVVSQFAVSVGLLIGTAVVYNQLNYFQNKKLGFNKDNVFYFPMQGNAKKNYDVLKTEMLKEPQVLNVTTSSHVPTQITSNGGGWDWDGRDPAQNVLMGSASFGYDYDQTFQLDIAAGRFYSDKFPSDAKEAVVINEEAVKIMGLKDPLGKRLSNRNNHFRIVGVIKNFHFKPLQHKIEPIVLFPGQGFQNYVFIRITSTDIVGILNRIQNIYKRIEPDYPFQYVFLDEEFNRLYRSELQLGKLFSYFALLAILISCIGLFGLASYLAESRTKEIGLRKALGASIKSIVFLLSKEFIKCVLLANLIAWPLAYYAMNQWLQGYAYRWTMDWKIFVLSGVMALIIALITVSFQTIRAAQSNPVESLRYE